MCVAVFIALLNVEDLKEACASSLVFTEREGEEQGKGGSRRRRVHWGKEEAGERKERKTDK